MEEVSIVVVDDHPLFRQGVINTLSLEPGFTVVGQAENGHDALAIIRKLHPMCCSRGYQPAGRKWAASNSSSGPGKITDPDCTY